MKNIILYGQGNLGAMSFLMILMAANNIAAYNVVFPKLEEAVSIRGTNLYVLWSDLCDQDLDKVVQLCTNCPTSVLEDACNRQDYSGRELVKPYFK